MCQKVGIAGVIGGGKVQQRRKVLLVPRKNCLVISNKIFKVRFYPSRDVEGRISIFCAYNGGHNRGKEGAGKIEAGDGNIPPIFLQLPKSPSHTIEINKLMEQVMEYGSKIVGCDTWLPVYGIKR